MPRFPQPLPERSPGTSRSCTGCSHRRSGRYRRHRRAFRRGRRSAEPLGSVAVPDQTRTGAGPLLPGPRAAYRRRLHRVCLRQLPRALHERQRHHHRLPKLDEGSYTDKLAAIIAANDITSVTVARMEVPCCGGLERAAAEACAQSGKDIPFEVVTFAVNGDVIG